MWLRIDEFIPEEGQEVFYYFGGFNKVYKGKYKPYYGADYPEGVFSNIFYSEKGWLTDDVTWWMPRKEGDVLPDHPTVEQKNSCLYHTDWNE